MSEKWSGFSEEDIRQLKTGKISSEDKHKRFILKSKKRLSPKAFKSNTPVINTEKVLPILEDAKLSTQEEVVDLHIGNEPVAVETKQTEKIENTENDTGSDIKPTLKSIVLTTNKIEKKVIDLDEFQARQKRIEEQNRRRKELLAKALADRTKQTEEEAKRLKEIQDDFKKLDALLSNDVAILRHQIEIASVDFMEAQKRYHKIEKEFLDAKLNLHQKLEKKEMLTEHLCAIIEKNEERKAEKLNALMAKLIVDGKNEMNNTDLEI